MEEKKKRAPKVYSPDVIPYSFEGRSYFFGTLLSIIVAPIRIMSRVMHNIYVLPANLQEDYADALMITSTVLFILGLIDIIVYRTWPLVVSQIPCIIYAVRLKYRAHISAEAAMRQRIIDIDEDAIAESCNEIYDELNKILED